MNPSPSGQKHPRGLSDPGLAYSFDYHTKPPQEKEEHLNLAVCRDVALHRAGIHEE